MQERKKPEEFFTPAERKATVLFRPREWREWWQAEPLVTKVFVGFCIVLLGLGIFTYRKNPDLGTLYFVLAGGLLGWVLAYAIANIVAASTRWSLKKAGLHAAAIKAWNGFLVLVKVLFWSALVIGMAAAAWPYLSWSPTKSWYAFTNSVPADRVEIQKEPHDCEFETAPLGSKHCHYDARAYVLKGADTPDGKKSLLVTYEKIED